MISDTQSMDNMDPGITVVVLFMLISTVSIDGAILAYKNTNHASRPLQRLNINHARQLLFRQRRAATDAGKMISKEVVLNGTEDHTQAYVHWSGKLKSEAVFILTLKYNATGVADSQTWRSKDYGTTYSKLVFDSGALISFFFVSPADHTKMVFTDIKNKRLYMSTDEMNTHTSAPLPAAVDDLHMHPKNSDWMLLYDYYHRKLYVSMNFGSNWTLLQSDVNPRFFWGVKGSDGPKIVHMEVQPQDSEQAYYKRCTIPDCKARGDGIDSKLGPFMTQTMLLINEYIFVQKSNLDGTDSHMMVSHKRQHFAHTYFPDNVQTKDFLVVDADAGQVFIAVNHGDRMGVSLYLSDPTGRFYVLSLSNVHHRAAFHWFDVDMHKVQGLNGTFLANQQLNSSNSSQRRLKSLVSFDRGGNWLEIPAPPHNCTSKNEDDCALLLRLDMASFLQNWILSEERAPGFIIAHGHYGRNYEHDLKNMSVFTSVDGGWTWSKSSLLGVYHFNILDQGSLITAIKTGDQEHTLQAHFSHDEGKTWQSEHFGSKKLIVDGVLNEPDINTVVVSIYGHENTSAAWTMIKLNFSQVLSRKCSDSDYVLWMPSDHDSTFQEQCLLGQRVQIRRRLRDSKCFNGEDFVRKIVNKTCKCEKEDFECDFGYSLQGDKCVQESWFDDGYIATNCTEGVNISKSQGYRKVGSDKCVGGVADSNPLYKPVTNATCPLAAPDHLLLVANVTVVATGRSIHFHLSQKRGSIHKTLYVWNFNDTHNVNMTGLDNAQQQNHSFSKAGIYYVSVNASNSKGKHSSNVVRIRVEDAVHTVAVFKSWAANVGFPVNVSVATNLRSSSAAGSSLHFLYRFGDEVGGQKETLTWDSHAVHTYKKPGNYIMSITAVNSVSAVTKQVAIKVIDDGVMVQLSFSLNVGRLFDRISYFEERVYILLDSIRQELALMLGIKRDRLAVSINSTAPVRLDVLILPRPPKSPPSEITKEQIVQTFVSMVGNKTLSLFRTAGLPKSFGDINVTAIKIFKDGGGGDSGGDDSNKKKGANYRAMYIAIPIVLLAALVTVLVLVYYRRRFRNMRRYSLVNQHEDTDALLDDDEDEPPLDLRSDSRDEGRSRDDAMLDLGTGSHLVMVTGSGGGDGPESC